MAEERPGGIGAVAGRTRACQAAGLAERRHGKLTEHDDDKVVLLQTERIAGYQRRMRRS